MDIKQIETVNKFANIEQTYNSKNQKLCKHTKSFVNMDDFDANISKRYSIILKNKRNIISAE
jgi:hypothetical protein